MSLYCSKFTCEEPEIIIIVWKSYEGLLLVYTMLDKYNVYPKKNDRKQEKKNTVLIPISFENASFPSKVF